MISSPNRNEGDTSEEGRKLPPGDLEQSGRAVLWSARHRAMATRACSEGNTVSLSSSSGRRPLKLSVKPFCSGLPDANVMPFEAALIRQERMAFE